VASAFGTEDLRDEWLDEEGGREGWDDDQTCGYYCHEEQEVAAIDIGSVLHAPGVVGEKGEALYM